MLLQRRAHHSEEHCYDRNSVSTARLCYCREELIIQSNIDYGLEEKLQAIEKDQQEYTLEEEEKKMHETLLKPECTVSDSFVLKKSLSRRYPDLAFEEALQTENEKLQEELQRMESCHKTEECDVIKHLIDVTETAATVPSENEEVESNRYFQRSFSHNSHQSEDYGGNGSPDAKIRKSQKGQKCAVM